MYIVSVNAFAREIKSETQGSLCLQKLVRKANGFGNSTLLIAMYKGCGNNKNSQTNLR